MTCPREGRFIGGCKFVARYEDVPLTTEEREYADSATYSVLLMIELLDTLKTTRYVRDVCIRCGKTVERDNS